MKRLRDYTKLGTVSDIKNNLKEQEKKLRKVGIELFQRHDLWIGCRV